MTALSLRLIECCAQNPLSGALDAAELTLWAMTSDWLRRTPTRRWRYPAGEFFIMIDFTAQQVTSDLSSGPIWSQVDIKDGPLVCESACKKDPLRGDIRGPDWMPIDIAR